MKFKKYFRIFINFLFWCFVGAIACLAILVLIHGHNLPDYKNLATYTPPVATRLYASDGSLLIEYAEERRVFIDFEDMPPQLINAFIAAEDQNFWTHPGIDVQGIIRASVNNGMGFDTKFTGASTITQQVAKNFFLTSDRTISRKVKEAILALRLERSFSKKHIMTLYLNEIFLGARAYGVGSAALMYFNKPVKDLSLAECAFLASLPKAPNDRNRAVERRNYVLNRMVKDGYITQEMADVAMAEPLNINSGFTEQMEMDFQYFAEDVRRKLLESIGRETLYNQGLYIKTTINPDFQRAAAAALAKELDEFNKNKSEKEPKLQGAIIAMNPHTGRILAMTGGRSFKESSFNRATQAYRQIGSTIKPFVYLSALEKGYSPESLILDAPIVGWRENNKEWKPENYDRKFLGNIPLRFSLETSRNVPTVRLVEQIGVPDAIESAQRFGVYPQDLKQMNESLALGSGETTLQKLVLGYSAFINGGHVIQPKMVDYIEDRYGNLIGGSKHTQIEWDDTLLPPSDGEKSEPLSDPQSLYQIVSILQGAVERGTGKQARVSGHTIAGKTGTTNMVKDVWFIGFSKNLIAGVYLGYDTPKPLGKGAGSHMAARVFADFMKVALKDESNQPFSVPDGLTIIRVNRNNGVAASQDPDGVIINEFFKPGQTPNKVQNTEKQVEQAVVGGIF